MVELSDKQCLVTVGSLTELIFALNRFGGEGRFAPSHLVDGRDSELVAGAVLQPRQCELPVHQLVLSTHSHKAVPANHARLKDVLCHFGATVILGWSPGDRDGVLGDGSDDQILWTLWDSWKRHERDETFLKQ